MTIIDKKFARLHSKISLLRLLLENSGFPKLIIGGIQDALTKIEEETAEKQMFYSIAQILPVKGWALRRILDAISILHVRLFRLNAAYSFLRTYSYQLKDPNLSSFNTIIKQYTKELCGLSHLDKDKILPMISHSYSCWPLSEIPFYPVFIPAHDSKLPNSWGILAHEFGHIYYDKKQDTISRKLLPKIDKVVRKKVSQLVSDTEAYTASRDAAFVWVRRWTPEFFADCFATRILGPAYIALSNVELLTEGAEVFPPSHPPTRTRISLCLETLRKLKLEGMTPYIEQLTTDFKEASDLPRMETDESRKLDVFLDQNILKECFKLIEDNVDILSIRKLWPEMLDAIEKLRTNKRMDGHSPLVPQVCAAVLLEEKYPLA